MYCSACGAAVQPGLSYCNRCGAKTGGEKAGKTGELSPNLVVAAIAVVFLAGLGGFMGLLALMKRGGGVDPIIVVGAGLTFVATFLLEVVLIWLLLRSMRGAKESRAAARLGEQTTKELTEAEARLLPEHMPSVTEQTTRAFAPLPAERKSK